MDTARKDKARVGLPLIISVFFHGLLLLLLGGVVLFPGYVVQTPIVGSMLEPQVEMAIPEEDFEMPSEPDAGGGGTGGMDDTVDATTVESTVADIPLNVLTSAALDSPVTLPSGGVSSGLSVLGSKGIGGGSGGGQGTGVGKGIGKGTSMFGATQKLNGALEGVFYDFKQTATGKPSGLSTKDWGGYGRKAVEFVKSGFDRSTLNDVYSAPDRIYATQVFIPRIKAGEAPKAFSVEVPPSGWMIHYRGMIRAPKDGEYRFAGRADDMLIVSVDSQLAVVTGWSKLIPYLRGPLEFDSKGTGKVLVDKKVAKLTRWGDLHAGPWFKMRKGQAFPINILVGETPGGDFNVSLFVERKGATKEGEGLRTVFSLAKQLGPVTAEGKELEVLEPLYFGD